MIKNLTQSTLIAKEPYYARTVLKSLRGLIGRDFTKIDAMVLPNCSMIHTYFMSMPIDVLFLDAENRVLKTVSDVRPWRLFLGCKHAKTTVEIPVGTIELSHTAKNDLIDLGFEAYTTNKNIKQYNRVVELEKSASVTLQPTGKL